jgi:hypothetical protein
MFLLGARLRIELSNVGHGGDSPCVYNVIARVRLGNTVVLRYETWGVTEILCIRHPEGRQYRAVVWESTHI